MRCYIEQTEVYVHQKQERKTLALQVCILTGRIVNFAFIAAANAETQMICYIILQNTDDH